MGKHLNRKFLAFMIHSYYLSRKDHYFHCVCYKCERLTNLMNELYRNNFYTSNLKLVCCISPQACFKNYRFSSFYLKMVKQIIVKFFQESEFSKEPTQATEGSAG